MILKFCVSVAWFMHCLAFDRCLGTMGSLVEGETWGEEDGQFGLILFLFGMGSSMKGARTYDEDYEIPFFVRI
jgi:hypothetical protein